MKKLYSMPEIIAGIIVTIMTILIFYFSIFKTEMLRDVRWAVIVGVYGGWNLTRSYYKEKR